MNIGFIFECGPQGADKKVCEHLARTVDAAAVIVNSITNTNKPGMIRDCGRQAKLLLGDGCDRVLIVWDLYPAWREGVRPNRDEDISAIRASLSAAGVDETRVRLLCIREELEAWIIADERAVAAYLSAKTTRSCKLKRVRDPEATSNPKHTLHRMFRGWKPKYVDTDHALPIIQNLPDLSRLQRVCSFARFVRLIGDPGFACHRCG